MKAIQGWRNSANFNPAPVMCGFNGPRVVSQVAFIARELRPMRYRFAVLPLLCLALVKSFVLSAERPVPTYRYTGHVSYNIAKVTFSRYGSYMAISQLPNEAHSQVSPGIYLRSMRGGQHPVFRIELLAAGSPVPFKVDASPTLRKLQ
jgi:hypothetical protein